MKMQFITMPAEDEYLIRHAAHVCQHANQHRRDINSHLRHIESDQANDHAVREELKEDDSAKDVLDLVRETANQCS